MPESLGNSCRFGSRFDKPADCGILNAIALVRPVGRRVASRDEDPRTGEGERSPRSDVTAPHEQDPCFYVSPLFPERATAPCR